MDRGLLCGWDTSALLPVIGLRQVFGCNRWLVETKRHFKGGITRSLTTLHFILDGHGQKNVGFAEVAKRQSILQRV